MAKYLMVYDFIKKLIDDDILKVNMPIESENALSKKFGVSRQTVRQGIALLAKNGYVYSLQGKGTYVKKASKTKAMLIAVMTTYINDYIFPSIIKGIDGILSKSKYSCTLNCTHNCHEKEREILEALIQKNISGLIVEPVKSADTNPNLDFYKKLMKQGVKILFIHSSYAALPCACLEQDDFWGGYTAAKHLIDNGHRKIGGIFYIHDRQGHRRFYGYRKALVDINAFNSSLSVWYESVSKNFEKDINMMLLSKCSALIVYNEQLVPFVMDILKSRNIFVPKDISLVSFDDSIIGALTVPKLTTIAHPKEKFGKMAANQMLDMLKGEQQFETVKITPILITRESTGGV